MTHQKNTLISTFFQKMVNLKQKYEIVKYRLFFELSQTYGFILFFRQWNSSTKVFESYEYTEKDVLPLYRFSIFTLKANKFNARQND